MAEKTGIVQVTEDGSAADQLRQVLRDTASRMDGADDKDYIGLAKQYRETALQLAKMDEEDEDDAIDLVSSKPDRKPRTNKARGAELHRKRSG